MKNHQRLSIKTKKVIQREKRSNSLNEIKPGESISNNPQRFLEISPMQSPSFT